jgi:hypothetical protein
LIAQNFDSSLSDELIEEWADLQLLSRLLALQTDFNVTFTGQGFSLASGDSVEDLIIISNSSSPPCACWKLQWFILFVWIQSRDESNHVSRQVSLQVSIKMDSGSRSTNERLDFLVGNGGGCTDGKELESGRHMSFALSNLASDVSNRHTRQVICAL